MASAPGFPQIMVHPHHAPAVVADFKSGEGLPGAPERFPPVEVHSEDQEAQLRARGYLRYGEAMPKLAEFCEYPKVLSHPGHVPATPATKASQPGENGMLIIVDVAARAAVLPDVTVHDEDEEAAWIAKGYREPGRSDEAAFERATLSPGAPGSEWPKWVDGVLMQDPNTPVDLSRDYPKWLHFDDGSSLLANDPPHERQIRLSRGELAQKAEPAPSPPTNNLPGAPPDDTEYQEFLAWKAAKTVPSNAPSNADAEERATLIALAEETGVDIDKRWGLKRLRQAVLGAEAAE